MRIRTLTTILAASFAAASLAQTTTTPIKGEPEIVPNVINVKVKPGQASRAMSAYRSIKGVVIARIPAIGWETIRLTGGTTLNVAIAKLRANSAFADVENDLVRHLTDLPNDARLGELYAVKNMQLDGAWGIGKANKNVVIAVIDSGVQLNHPDLAANLVPGFDFVNGDSDPSDDNGHGTHCAGIAAAIGNNGIGIAGVAYGASIMPIKAADAAGGLNSSNISQSIAYAATHGANVISMSFGGGGLSDMEQEAIDLAISKNVVCVASAGNNNESNKNYPGAYPPVICVGATDAADARTYFSNYGKDWVDVAAPGLDVLSTTFDGGYGLKSGTSMSCPEVSGLATLIMSQFEAGAVTNAEVRAYIEDNTDPISDPVIGQWVAKGRVNAFKSMNALPIGLSDVAEPTNLYAVSGNVPVTGPTAPTSDELRDSDGSFARLTNSLVRGTGLVGSLETSFTTTKLTPAQLRSAKLSISFSAPRLTAIQVFVLGTNGRYSLAKSLYADGTVQSLDLSYTGTKLASVMNGSTMRIMVRSLLPTRLIRSRSSETAIDKIGVTFTGRTN